MDYSIKDNLLRVVPSEVQSSRGCYALLYFYKNRPRKIKRIFGDDKHGILYIGKADVIIDRILSLQKAVLLNSDFNLKEPKEVGHKTLSKKFFRIRERLNVNDLKIRIYHDSRELPVILESYLLEQYVNLYGELPPLNGQYGIETFEVLVNYFGTEYPFD